MKRAFLSLASFAVLAAACGPVASSNTDPRVGDRGLLRFNGGGCSGSTAMAVGSRETLTLEALDGAALPDALSARTSAPDVIAASMSTEGPELSLEAHASGESRVEVLRAGRWYDGLTFTAEPAAVAVSASAPRVLTGGVLDVVVTDVFGACKTSDCPLFGHSFLGWRSEPAHSLAFVIDDRGTAMFLAGEPGNAQVIGREPALGAEIVSAAVSIESREGVTGLAAELTTIPLEEGETPTVIELPGTVAAGTAFCVRVDAVRDHLPSVAISRKDVVWTIEGDGVEAVAADHASEPLGTVFVANSAGPVTLSAHVELVDLGRAFELNVTP